MGRVSRLVEKYELLAQQQISPSVVSQPSQSCPEFRAKVDVKVQNASTNSSLLSLSQEDEHICTGLKDKRGSRIDVIKSKPDSREPANERHSVLKGDGKSTSLKAVVHSKTALAVNKASHYFLLLNEADEHHLAQLLKSVDSTIFLGKKPGKLSGLLKTKEGALCFKNMLEVAEEAMKLDKLAALALLQRMRSNEWAKSVMRFHSTLKSHHQALYHQIVDQVVKDSGHLFAEAMHRIDRQELFNRIQSGDKIEHLSQVCPHLIQLASLWDQIKFTIIDEVLKEEEVKQRTAIIELFIRVAYQAMEKYDFSTAAAVWDGLQSESIRENRLVMSWDGLSKESTKMHHMLTKKLGKMCSAINEKDMKRMAELPVKIHSIPLLNPYLATLVMAKERQKALSQQILEEEKLLQEDVSFFNKCKSLKREEGIKDKIEELAKELKALNREKNKKVCSLDLINKIENVASRLKLAQTVHKAVILPSDKDVFSRSIHLEHIHALEKGIEKYDRQMSLVIEMILKLADQMRHYLRHVSHYGTDLWINRRHLSFEQRKKAEEQAYQRSLKLEPLAGIRDE